jgi:hypothetical protein
MKKYILEGIVVITIAIIVALNINFSPTTSDLSDITIGKIEALADTEYEVGSPFTNWREYEMECTVTWGIAFIVYLEHSYTYKTTGCGYGTGWCLSPAGC